MESLTLQRLSAYLERCRNLYGVAGSILSGGAYPHWPQDAKHRVRLLNRAMNRLCAAGFAARPYRVRMDTMRNLRLTTQTDVIRFQHGSIE
jgi:hypothetical protein